MFITHVTLTLGSARQIDYTHKHTLRVYLAAVGVEESVFVRYKKLPKLEAEPILLYILEVSNVTACGMGQYDPL